MTNVLGLILAILGFLTAVVGPLVTAAAGNPALQSNQELQKIFAGVGVVMGLAGTLKVLILNWQASNEEHVEKLATLKQPTNKA